MKHKIQTSEYFWGRRHWKGWAMETFPLSTICKLQKNGCLLKTKTTNHICTYIITRKDLKRYTLNC